MAVAAAFSLVQSWFSAEIRVEAVISVSVIVGAFLVACYLRRA
jgi:hypothetical protein